VICKIAEAWEKPTLWPLSLIPVCWNCHGRSTWWYQNGDSKMLI